jgi:FMN hydrolase / 5-amino-6-(5-phospho-D-ribitylamino)uracil phosphatase
MRVPNRVPKVLMYTRRQPESAADHTAIAVHGIRAIIFDLDDTLWEVGPVILRAEHAMHEFLARSYPRVTGRHDLRSMREVRARMAVEHPAMRHDFTWLRLEALRHHAREASYPESMAAEAFEVFYRVRNEVTLYADVLPTLQTLAGRFRLFALSNGNADLGRVGLGHYFEAALAARDAGMLKPDPRIFELLLERAGLRRDEVLHVGDDPEADVEGARAAGVAPVWLNRSALPWPRESAAPASIRSLDELAAAVPLATQARAST